MAKKEFNPSDWLHSPSGESAVMADTKANYSQALTIDDEIEQLVCAVESSCTDIAPDYIDWLRMGFALADALGEGGRSYFHRLSRFYSQYDEKDADQQFDKCLKSHGSGVNIGTLFFLAQKAGITISPKLPISPQGDLGKIGEIVEPDQPDEEPMPTFSQEVGNLLPDILHDVVHVAHNFDDADLLILGSIVVLSACLPNVYGIYDRRNIYPNLFLFVSAPASSGKGRLSLCRYLAQPIQNDLKRQYDEEYEDYKYRLNEYTLDTKNNEKPEEPSVKMMFIPGNSSATAVYQTLHENEGRGLLFETEGDTLAYSFKSDYGNFSDGLRKAFHHEQISYNRRKDRELVEIPNPKLSVALSGTPRQILTLINDSENGLFSRFIFYKLNFQLVWRDVFADKDKPLDDYFEHLGEIYFQFYQKLKNSSTPIRFSFSQPQEVEFNEFFKRVQNDYYYMFGEDIIASVRRLGLITFRIAMVITMLRHMDDSELSPTIVCDDNDFRSSLIMAGTLLKHTEKVYGDLPTAESNTPGNGLTVLNQKFYDNLPPEFDRKTFLAVADKLNISSRSADKLIRRLCNKGKLKHLSHGNYGKP